MTSPTQVTEEQAAFIEEKTKAIFDYTIDCLDRARSEANNLLQWYFGAIAGGVALASELRTEGFVVLAIGVATAVAAAATFACLLISEMKSRFTMPPGNTAENLRELLKDPMPRMRWLECLGMDGRTANNTRVVDDIAEAVDKARRRFSLLPLWIIGGAVVAWRFVP
jgi:hypothetical protein